MARTLVKSRAAAKDIAISLRRVFRAAVLDNRIRAYRCLGFRSKRLILVSQHGLRISGRGGNSSPILVSRHGLRISGRGGSAPVGVPMRIVAPRGIVIGTIRTCRTPAGGRVGSHTGSLTGIGIGSTFTGTTAATKTLNTLKARVTLFCGRWHERGVGCDHTQGSSYASRAL
jgi:hypothetical protein